MNKNRIDKTPFILVALVVMAFFFLSCTKKPASQATNDGKDGRQPASNMYTTPHGFKVQFEPAVVAPQKK